jgi:hypothetical protein
MGEFSYRPEFKEVMDDLLLVIPGIATGKGFGHIVYKVNGKIFCFVGDEQIILKLPQKRVKAVIADLPEAKPFEANGVWKEWVAIVHDDPEAYRQHEDLYHESLEFVSSR